MTPAPSRLRHVRRPSERRQVDAHQRPRRREGRDHLVEAADHAPCHPGHRAHRPTGSSSSSTPPASTARARCSASGSTASSAATLGDVDVIGFCVPADEKIGPGDRFINEQLDAFPRAKKVAIVTKIDAASTHRRRRAPARGERAARVGGDRAGVGVEPDPARCAARRADRAAAGVRAALSGRRRHRRDRSRPASPSSSARPRSRASATSCRTRSRSRSTTWSSATTRTSSRSTRTSWVERDSQKGIIIGHKGAAAAGCRRARPRAIEPLVGKQVFLSLRVKVAKEWQRDPKQLGRLGF